MLSCCDKDLRALSNSSNSNFSVSMDFDMNMYSRDEPPFWENGSYSDDTELSKSCSITLSKSSIELSNSNCSRTELINIDCSRTELSNSNCSRTEQSKSSNGQSIAITIDSNGESVFVDCDCESSSSEISKTSSTDHSTPSGFTTDSSSQ